MEVVIYAVLTLVLWMTSLTILLPFLLILKYNKNIQNIWFSFFYVKVGGAIAEPTLKPLRKQAFELLGQELERKDVTVPLKVLEIGIGYGANLQYYPENCNLTALDVNASFDSYFLQNRKKYPQVNYERMVHSMAEDMKDIDDSSMDLVISTYVFCSVVNPAAVLKEINRVLKPGGKFLFLEHISFPVTDWRSTVQRFMGPLWFIYGDGCYITRFTDQEITKFGFSNVVCQKKYPPSVILYLRPNVMGVATK